MFAWWRERWSQGTPPATSLEDDLVGGLGPVLPQLFAIEQRTGGAFLTVHSSDFVETIYGPMNTWLDIRVESAVAWESRMATNYHQLIGGLAPSLMHFTVGHGPHPHPRRGRRGCCHLLCGAWTLYGGRRSRTGR